ncbi:TPA: molecular chaperone [Escherichia coli]|nr:molecular chaperone [Escherichia coli]
MKKYNITILSFIFFSHISLAETGGIYLDTTRVIFDSNDLSTKVKFNNNTDKNWLLRAWVSDYNSKNKNDNFIITPPLYKISANESFQFKIDKLKENFPNDRESIFHINVMAIPPITNDEKDSNNAVQFAINTRIKLIYRPHKINNKNQVSDAYKNLKITSSKETLTVSNHSPYYITMNDVKINGKNITSIKDFMVSPFSTLIIPEKNAKTISYSTINDYGGETPIQNIKL